MFGLKLLIRISCVNHQFLRSIAENNLVPFFTICVCVCVCTHTIFLLTALEKEIRTNLFGYAHSHTSLSTTCSTLMHKKWTPHRNSPQNVFYVRCSLYMSTVAVPHLKSRMTMSILSRIHFPVRTNQQILLS